MRRVLSGVTSFWTAKKGRRKMLDRFSSSWCTVSVGVTLLAPVAALASLTSEEPPMSVSLTIPPSAINVSAVGEILVRNLDERPVSAFVLLLRVVNAAGKTVSSDRIVVCSNEIVPGMKTGALRKGMEWRGKTAEMKPVSESALTYRIEPTLDYVLFTNGERWGPDRAKASLYIEGMKQGAWVQRRASAERD
jgi:hypothetical protein